MFKDMKSISVHRVTLDLRGQTRITDEQGHKRIEMLLVNGRNVVPVWCEEEKEDGSWTYQTSVGTFTRDVEGFWSIG